MLGKDLEG